MMANEQYLLDKYSDQIFQMLFVCSQFGFTLVFLRLIMENNITKKIHLIRDMFGNNEELNEFRHSVECVIVRANECCIKFEYRCYTRHTRIYAKICQ